MIIAGKRKSMEKIIKILDSIQEKFSSRTLVLQLCSEDVTDYERGKIQGQIDMLTEINLKLAEGDNDEENITSTL